MLFEHSLIPNLPLHLHVIVVAVAGREAVLIQVRRCCSGCAWAEVS